jgi:hypothetical protein
MGSDRADRVGHCIAEIVHVDHDRDRLLSHSTATQFTEFPTLTQDRPAPISGQPDRHDRFRVPPSISDDLTATQTREYLTTRHAAAASGGWLDAAEATVLTRPLG